MPPRAHLRARSDSIKASFLDIILRSLVTLSKRKTLTICKLLLKGIMRDTTYKTLFVNIIYRYNCN